MQDENNVSSSFDMGFNYARNTMKHTLDMYVDAAERRVQSANTISVGVMTEIANLLKNIRQDIEQMKAK